MERQNFDHGHGYSTSTAITMKNPHKRDHYVAKIITESTKSIKVAMEALATIKMSVKITGMTNVVNMTDSENYKAKLQRVSRHGTLESSCTASFLFVNLIQLENYLF